jgi:hypothetical protein
MDPETDRFERDASPSPHWSSWDSPVGLGLFIALVAVAIAVIALAFR